MKVSCLQGLPLCVFKDTLKFNEQILMSKSMEYLKRDNFIIHDILLSIIDVRTHVLKIEYEDCCILYVVTAV